MTRRGIASVVLGLLIVIGGARQFIEYAWSLRLTLWILFDQSDILGLEIIQDSVEASTAFMNIAKREGLFAVLSLAAIAIGLFLIAQGLRSLISAGKTPE